MVKNLTDYHFETRLAWVVVAVLGFVLHGLEPGHFQQDASLVIATFAIIRIIALVVAFWNQVNE